MKKKIQFLYIRHIEYKIYMRERAERAKYIGTAVDNSLENISLCLQLISNKN